MEGGSRYVEDAHSLYTLRTARAYHPLNRPASKLGGSKGGMNVGRLKDP